MPSVLAYWDIRGLAQPIRLLLNYVGEEFEDRMYSCGPGPDFSRDSWLSVKNSFGLDFPNLPYYINGDIKLTQSNTILRFIGRKNNLCGESPEEQARVDLCLNEVADFRGAFTRTCYAKTFKDLKEPYLKAVVPKIQLFENFIGDRKFFAGDKVTIGDFPIYEILDHHLLMEPTILDNFPKLKAFQQRFEELPAIKTYMASDKFMKYPLNNKMASFGGAVEEKA